MQEVHAQESNVIGAPLAAHEVLEKFHQSGIPQPRPHRSMFALDRAAVRFGLLQGGAELFDGVTTRYFVNHCATCVEADPASRALLGRRPNWRGMITFGSVEAISTAYVYQAMHRSSNKWLRGLAPCLPISVIVIHVTQGASNVPTIPSHTWGPRRRKH